MALTYALEPLDQPRKTTESIVDGESQVYNKKGGKKQKVNILTSCTIYHVKVKAKGNTAYMYATCICNG